MRSVLPELLYLLHVFVVQKDSHLQNLKRIELDLVLPAQFFQIKSIDQGLVGLLVLKRNLCACVKP